MRIIVSLCLLALSACTTTHDLGGGRYIVPAVVEVRSPFGTNMGFAMAQMCDGAVQSEEGLQPLMPTIEYRNCQQITDWYPMYSQGQGGEIVQGLLTFGGLIGLGAVMPSEQGASLSQSQSMTVAPSKGGPPFGKGPH